MDSFKVVFGFLFVLLVGTIAVLGIISYTNNSNSLETAARVQHTHEVLDHADQVASLYKDIQLEGNGFYISRDSVLVQPYRVARQAIHPLLDKLQDLTTESQTQQQRIDSLRLLIRALITFTDTGLERDGSYSADGVRERVRQNHLFRRQIRDLIASIKAEEYHFLAERERAHQESVDAFGSAFFWLSCGIGVLLVATFVSIRYNFNKRIKAQAQQKKSNELFVKLFYESPIGIVISRLDTGEIIDCNKAYSELLNFNKSELIGKTAVQLGILGSPSQRAEIVDGARKEGTVRDYEVQLKPNGSAPIWASISMQTLEIDHEICLLSAILDMTAHKEAEIRIKETLNKEIELNKLKSNFVSLASHEFRTPLTAILSSAVLLENYSSGENKSKISKHVSRIKASVNLLTSILNEFLSLTKIEEGKIDPKTEMFNIKEMIEGLCNNFKSIKRPGQQIVYTHTGTEMICSDPVLMGNILTNLVSNAIKYSNDDSDITITSEVNARVHLSVKDSGIGISKADQEHLFERFFRASNTGTIQGTGLGLHILKHYVNMLHGTIQVESEPGKGSEFKVTFDAEPTFEHFDIGGDNKDEVVAHESDRISD